MGCQSCICLAYHKQFGDIRIGSVKLSYINLKNLKMSLLHELVLANIGSSRKVWLYGPVNWKTQTNGWHYDPHTHNSNSSMIVTGYECCPLEKMCSTLRKPRSGEGKFSLWASLDIAVTTEELVYHCGKHWLFCLVLLSFYLQFVL